MALRVGSYIKREPRGEDHCIKSQDWCFILLPERVTDEDETRERIMLKVGEELKSIDTRRVIPLGFPSWGHHCFAVLRAPVDLSMPGTVA